MYLSVAVPNPNPNPKLSVLVVSFSELRVFFYPCTGNCDLETNREAGWLHPVTTVNEREGEWEGRGKRERERREREPLALLGPCPHLFEFYIMH